MVLLLHKLQDMYLHLTEKKIEIVKNITDTFE